MASVATADPARTALLVMDYQGATVSRLPEAEGPALLNRVAGTIATARGSGATIGYVHVGFTPDDLAAIPETNKAFAAMAAQGAMPAGGPAVEIVEQLAPRDGDIVVRKTRIGAFSTTDLHEQLARRGITTLVLAGISTSGVVLSTLRDAADRDYRLLVLSDGCADSDEEAHHLLMDKLFPRQADILTTAELPQALRAGR